MATLTILTPTYNRAARLGDLYKSLSNQTSFDFEWLVVDDGSCDNTEKIFSKLTASENKFKITYLKKENGGKHTAVNLGVKNINSPLTMIVDSDDTLTAKAVETIKKYYNKYKNNPEIGILTFLKVCSDGKVVVPIEKEEFVDSYIDYRIKGERPGDMAEVFLTQALKENPFPVFKDEKFLSEDVGWIKIGLQYKSVYINKPIYIANYLKDGLTSNDKPMKFASPKGSMLRGKMLMTKGCGLKSTIRGAIIYSCYKREVDSLNEEILQPDGLKQLHFVWFAEPLGLLFNKLWKKSR